MLIDQINSHFQLIKKSDRKTLASEIRYLLDFIETQPFMKNTAETSFDDITVEQIEKWAVVHNGENFKPWKDEKTQRSYSWKMLKVVAKYETTDFTKFLPNDSELNIPYSAKMFIEVYVFPIEKYLISKIEVTSGLLNLFERYKRTVEWFDYEELNIKAKKDEEADRNSNIEAIYDKHLRKFLLSNGVDYPLSKAEIDNYQPDILANIESKNALVCEVKIYDGINRNKANIISGVTQSLKYAKICNKKEVFLVIFNRSKTIIEIDAAKDFEYNFPFLFESGVKIHIVIIDSNHDVSPSKSGKSSILKLTRDDLVSEIINE